MSAVNECHNFFEPKSVCVIGASKKEDTMSYSIVSNMLESGFSGELTLVNRKGGCLFGYEIFENVAELETVFDLVLVFLPAKYVAESIEQLAILGTRHFVVYSAGFLESGLEGQENQKDLERIVQEYGIKLIGPNCMGLLDVYSQFNATNWFYTKEKGNISFVSQSGAYGMIFSYMAKNRHLGFSKFINIGNSLSIGFEELLDYLEEDINTEIIILYMEGIRDTKGFFKTCKRIAKNKPIIVLKAGKTDYGKEASMTHTGAIAMDHNLFEIACDDAGILVAEEVDDVFDLVQMLMTDKKPSSNKVAILSPSGGPCIIASDACSRYGLLLPEFTDNTIKLLEMHLPYYASKKNPLDITTHIAYENSFEVLKAVANDTNVDGLIIMIYTEVYSKGIEATIDYLKSVGKPFAFVMLEEQELYKDMVKKSVPLFFSPERAIKAYKAIYKYEKWCHTNELSDNHLQVSYQEKKSISGSFEQLTEYKTRDFLSTYDIPFNKCKLLNVPLAIEDVHECLSEFTFPVVMKIEMDGAFHRSDVDGIALNLMSSDEVYKKIVEWQNRAWNLNQVIIAEQVVSGTEFIVGYKRESIGDLVMFGLGGVFSEVIKDVSFALLPLTYDDAVEMIGNLKYSNILNGYRGSCPVNVNELAKLLVKVSDMVYNCPSISELDLNPVIAHQDKVTVVDATVVVDSNNENDNEGSVHKPLCSV